MHSHPLEITDRKLKLIPERFYARWGKRAMDIGAALAGLILISPLLVMIALAVRLESRGPILFRQQRIGRRMRPFNILKFRTMVVDSSGGPQITVGRDPRITRVGWILRRTKLDELPQLFNVLGGDMSLVGPRPEVPRYVALFPESFAEVLVVRPGITDPASLKYHNEAELLAEADDAEQAYVSLILPDKLALAKGYVQRCSLRFDLQLIFKTLLRVFK